MKPTLLKVQVVFQIWVVCSIAQLLLPVTENVTTMEKRRSAMKFSRIIMTLPNSYSSLAQKSFRRRPGSSIDPTLQLLLSIEPMLSWLHIMKIAHKENTIPEPSAMTRMVLENDAMRLLASDYTRACLS